MCYSVVSAPYHVLLSSISPIPCAAPQYPPHTMCCSVVSAPYHVLLSSISPIPCAAPQYPPHTMCCSVVSAPYHALLRMESERSKNKTTRGGQPVGGGGGAMSTLTVVCRQSATNRCCGHRLHVVDGFFFQCEVRSAEPYCVGMGAGVQGGRAVAVDGCPGLLSGSKDPTKGRGRQDIPEHAIHGGETVGRIQLQGVAMDPGWIPYSA